MKTDNNNNKSLNRIEKEESIMNKKISSKTIPSRDFPKDCVTLETFFSDLEDYIYNLQLTTYNS